MKKYLLLAMLLNSALSFANEQLVIKVFEAAKNDIETLVDFSPRYELLVSEEPLIDNRGSLVDALGMPGKIILHKKTWLDFYRKGIDVRLLVLHELMRSAGINDDDYVQSLPLIEDLYRVEENQNIKRRNETPYCALNVSEFSFEEKTKKIKVSGDSRPMTGGVISFPNPFAKEATDNAFINASELCLENGYETFRYESGQVMIRNSQTNFKTENITRATLRGRCVKKEPKKRRASVIREESCQKAMSCLNTLDSYPETSGKQEVIGGAQKLKEKHCGGKS